jgi:hypothetical protein
LNTSRTGSGENWSPTDFNQRYVSIQANCPLTYAAITNQAYALISYRDSHTNIYQSLINDMI